MSMNRKYKLSLSEADSAFLNQWNERMEYFEAFGIYMERQPSGPNSSKFEQGIEGTDKVPRMRIDIEYLASKLVQVSVKIFGLGEPFYQLSVLDDEIAKDYISEYYSRLKRIAKSANREECKDVPAGPKFKRQWQEIYKDWKILKEEYAEDFADRKTRRAKPFIEEFIVWLSSKGLEKGRVREKKTVEKIIRAGDAGCLD